MKRKLLLLLGIMALMAAAGAVFIILINPRNHTRRLNSLDKLQVVTTIYPVYMAGLNIADQIDEMEVKSLTRLNTGCLHDYQLTTEDMKMISEADVLIINGGGMENFIDDITDNYPHLTIIDASEGINKLSYVASDYVEEGEEEGHDYGGYNPHVWLNPKLYIKEIENIQSGLINYIKSTDTERTADAADLIEKIEKNTQSYIKQVSDIDSQIDEIMDDFIPSSKEMKAVIFHDSFAYLADRISMKVAFTVPLDSDTALSAGDIAGIIKDAREQGIKFLFTEQQYSDSIARQIEEETDAKVYVIDSAVTGDGSKDSYIKAMQRNLAVLQEALQ
jgi:zinc transport system substrate-binding protein